jgi:formylmethanofuran dehydrogenase subunit A
LKDDTKIYVLKPEFLTPEKISEATTKLNQIIQTNKTKLLSNPVLGKGGNYDITGKTKKNIKSEIGNVDLITPEIFKVDIPDLSKDVDL